MKKAMLGAAIAVALIAVGETVYIYGFGGDSEFAVTIFMSFVALLSAVARSLSGRKALFRALDSRDEEAGLHLLSPLQGWGSFVDVETRNRRGETLLAVAADQGLKGVVKRLIEKGADVNSRNREGSSPLHLGVRSREPLVVLRLLRAGADPTLSDGEGRTALMEAAFLGDRDMVDLLLQEGADAGQVDREGRNAADWALLGAHEELSKRLRAP